MADANENLDMAEMNAIRRNVVALQKSASNLVQMDINELSALLPPGTPKERLMEIRSKVVQLHLLQNGAGSPPEDDNASLLADGTTNRGSRYKTELCRPFEENGICKYGTRCQFAHGMAELRNLTRHPKYKSQLCRTFHSNGLCPYGHRCHFIHNQDEARAVVPSRASSIPIPNAGMLNSNNARRENTHTEFAHNEWGRRASFSNFTSETLQKSFPNSLMQSLLRGPVPTAEMPIRPAMPPMNGFKPPSSSLGSAGELTPPISPILYPMEDPFPSQTPFRHGSFPQAVPGGSPDPNLNPLSPFPRFSTPLVGSCPETGSIPPGNEPWRIPENSQRPNTSQIMPPTSGWNGERS